MPAPTSIPQPKLIAGQDGCARCGGTLEDGYELRVHGDRDPETGYVDEWAICASCIEKENGAAEDFYSQEDFYDAMDQKFHEAYESGELF